MKEQLIPVAIVIVLAIGIHMVQGQQIKFALSEVENLKLENLKLKQQLLNCQIPQATANLNQEWQQYITETLKAHGNPADVKFDSQKFQFVVEEKKKEK